MQYLLSIEGRYNRSELIVYSNVPFTSEPILRLIIAHAVWNENTVHDVLQRLEYEVISTTSHKPIMNFCWELVKQARPCSRNIAVVPVFLSVVLYCVSIAHCMIKR